MKIYDQAKKKEEEANIRELNQEQFFFVCVLDKLLNFLIDKTVPKNQQNWRQTKCTHTSNQEDRRNLKIL